ncbi:CENP-S associating centromere protein X-domain-containing protein [Podospora aff. communis PSN243]|uniref:CENP-S associating centromere protein X-domain-containing protein n=1 Tax=Podospora aff. communis PSN243 TaxID=3040156 RepID=A0AAV9G8B5_9PEZI|nr:CENP-S associating centromere protein X-domain-containing protein [Podospora aff. communis PSN243]
MPPKKTTAAASGSRGAATAKAASKPKPTAAKPANARGRPSNASSRPSTSAARETITISDDEAPHPSRRDRDGDENMEESEELEDEDDEDEDVEEEEDEEERISIPPELITRVLHEFFAKEGTRITRDANEAVGMYVDIFVREAIARAGAEREGGFLEVKDLEKITPQLLMDL